MLGGGVDVRAGLQQDARRGRAAAHRGVKQRRIAARVGEVDVRMVFQKYSHDAQMTAHRSVGNGRHPVGPRSFVHPEATIEQQPDDTRVAPKRRGVQRARAIVVPRSRIGTAREQRLDGFLQPEIGGCRDGGLCHSITSIRVCALLE